MTRYTPDQIETAARIALQHARTKMGIGHLTLHEWSLFRHVEIPAFTAGLATLPDHTAELLGAIDKIREIGHLTEKLDWYAEHGPPDKHDELCKQIDTLSQQVETALSNARTQIKGKT